MDIQAFDKALQEIVKKRTDLEKIDYNNPKYDDLEEQLHDLEDAFSVSMVNTSMTCYKMCMMSCVLITMFSSQLPILKVCL